MPAGQPPKYKTKEQLEQAVNSYFLSNDRITLSGLAIHLGIDRQTLYNYKKDDKFFDILKKARDKVEAYYEERAIYEDRPTGVIFALKNMGWSDKQEIEQTNSGEMKITITRKLIK